MHNAASPTKSVSKFQEIPKNTFHTWPHDKKFTFNEYCSITLLHLKILSVSKDLRVWQIDNFLSVILLNFTNLVTF